MRFSQMIKKGLINDPSSFEAMEALYLPEEKFDEVRKEVAGINWLYTVEDLIKNDDHLGMCSAATQIIGSAIYRHHIDAEIYFVFCALNAPLRSAYFEKKFYLILIDAHSLDNLKSLCFNLGELSPFAELIEQKPKILNIEHSNLSLHETINILSKTEYKTTESNISENCYHMFAAGMTYAIAHELGHIFNGHLAFSANKKHRDFFFSIEEASLTKRTLEMDADSLAVDWVFELWQTVIMRSHESSKISDEIKEKNIRTKQIVFIAGVYAANLFRDSLQKNLLPSFTHPSGYARFLISFYLLTTALQNNLGDTGGVLPEIVRLKMVDAFSRISGGFEFLLHPFAADVYTTKSESNKIDNIQNKTGLIAGTKELDPLHGRWARIRPFLDQYRLGRKLAPASAPPI